MTQELKQAAQTLLAHVVDKGPGRRSTCLPQDVDALRRALTAAQPAQNEWEAFEAWFDNPRRQPAKNMRESMWDAYQAGRASLPTQPAQAAQVLEGWTDRHCRVAAFALHRFASEAHNMVNVSAQKNWQGEQGAHIKFAADAKDADEARGILLTAAQQGAEQAKGGQ